MCPVYCFLRAMRTCVARSNIVFYRVCRSLKLCRPFWFLREHGRPTGLVRRGVGAGFGSVQPEGVTRHFRTRFALKKNEPSLAGRPVRSSGSSNLSTIIPEPKKGFLPTLTPVSPPLPLSSVARWMGESEPTNPGHCIDFLNRNTTQVRCLIDPRNKGLRDLLHICIAGACLPQKAPVAAATTKLSRAEAAQQNFSPSDFVLDVRCVRERQLAVGTFLPPRFRGRHNLFFAVGRARSEAIARLSLRDIHRGRRSTMKPHRQHVSSYGNADPSPSYSFRS